MNFINWNKLVELLLPTFLRRPMLLAFLRAAVTPIKNIHTEFLKEKQEWDYRLKHDGKVWSFEEVLNDKYDNNERRIYITDIELQDDVYIGNFANREQEYISCSGDDQTMHIGSAPWYYAQADFIVHVPAELLAHSDTLIKNTIGIYKIVGKTYILIEI